MKKLLLGLVGGDPVAVAVLLGADEDQSHRPAADLQHVPGNLHPARRARGLYEESHGREAGRSAGARSIDIGKANVGIGMVYRGKLDKPGADSVAEHDQVSEVYHIIDGSATLVLGPDIVNRQRRPATQRTVVEFNGPGNNGSEHPERRRRTTSRPATSSSFRRAPATGSRRSTITSTI